MDSHGWGVLKYVKYDMIDMIDKYDKYDDTYPRTDKKGNLEP